MEILYSFLIGYLSGSLPTAFIILKFAHGVDIRNEGSGNVGAMNSYEVTNSKSTGIIVFLIDFSKGLVPVLLTYFLIQESFFYCALTLNASVLAHCYSPWLKFKGGKGLATATGGALLISPLILAAWLIIWYIFYSFKKDINQVNIITSLIIWFFSIIFVDIFPSLLTNTKGSTEFRIFVSTLFLIILSKHFVHIRGIIKKKF